MSVQTTLRRDDMSKVEILNELRIALWQAGRQVATEPCVFCGETLKPHRAAQGYHFCEECSHEIDAMDEELTT